MIRLLVAALWLLQTCNQPPILGGKEIFPLWGCYIHYAYGKIIAVAVVKVDVCSGRRLRLRGPWNVTP